MVKPIEYFNFSLKLDKAIRICKKLHGYQIYVPSEQGTVKIDIADLIYIESAKHYLYLHTSKETFRLRSTMGDFIAQLPTGMDFPLSGKQRVCKWKGIIDFPFL